MGALDKESPPRGVLKECRDFAIRGHVVNLAVGVIIGAAFGSVAKSMVDDRFEKEQAAAPAAPPADVQLLTDIRDILRQK